MLRSFSLAIVAAAVLAVVAPAAAQNGTAHWGVAGLQAALAAPIPRPTQLPADNTVTVVTAYFQLKKSKFSHGHYQGWMRNIMTSVTSPLVVFTLFANEPSLRELRGNLPTVYVAYEDLWQSPLAAHYQQLFTAQHAIDREQHIHRPELYAVWNSKPWFVAAAALQNPFNSTYFMWVDAGSFRHRSFVNWPSPTKLSNAFKQCPHDSCMMLGKISEIGQTWTVNPREKVPLVGDMMEGGFFSGSRSAVLWWLLEFLDLIHDHSSRGIFVGKDQTLFNRLAVQNYWRVMWLASYKMPGCGPDVWFSFQYALSDDPSAAGCNIITEMYNGTMNLAVSPAA